MNNRRSNSQFGKTRRLEVESLEERTLLSATVGNTSELAVMSDSTICSIATNEEPVAIDLSESFPTDESTGIENSSVENEHYSVSEALPILGMATVNYLSPASSIKLGDTLTIVLSPNGENIEKTQLRVWNSQNGINAVNYRIYDYGVDYSGKDEWTYTVTEESVGKYLLFEVCYVCSDDPTIYCTVSTTDTITLEGDITGVTIESSSTSQIITNGTVLTADPVPDNATASYQWYRVSTAGEETLIKNATNAKYSVQVADVGYYLNVKIEGIGNWDGSASATTWTITTGALSSITLNSTTPVYGATLTTTLSPTNAKDSVAYQWYRVSSNGEETPITGATDSSYIVATEDVGYYIGVEATGTGVWEGSSVYAQTQSLVTGSYVVALTPDTPTITWSETSATTLTLTMVPEAALGTVRWFRVSGTGSSEISTNLNSTTYTVTAEDVGCTIRVDITPRTGWTGATTLSTSSPVQGAGLSVTVSNLYPVWNSTAPSTVEAILSRSVTPGSVTYQWYRGETRITNATQSTYTVTANDVGETLTVKVSGTYWSDTPQASTGAVNGTVANVTLSNSSMKVGSTISCASYTPSTATVTYQWYRYDGNKQTIISGATSNTYSIQSTDAGYFLRLIVTGTGYWNGSPYATSSSVVGGTISSVTLNTTAPVYGSTITTTLSPYTLATASYKWYRGSSSSSISEDTGVTTKDYTVTNADLGKYIKVIVTGTGTWSGSVNASTTTAVTGTLKGVSISTGNEPVAVGTTFTAALDPSVASSDVTFQWSSGDTLSGTFTPIADGVSQSYTAGSAFYNKYLKVTVTPKEGSYWGTMSVFSVTSTVLAPQVTVTGSSTEIGSIFSVVLDEPATGLTYQWYRTDKTNFTQIASATGSSYTATAEDVGYYLRCEVKKGAAWTSAGMTDSVITGKITWMNLWANEGMTLLTADITPDIAKENCTWTWAILEGTNWRTLTSTGNTLAIIGSYLEHEIKATAVAYGNWSGEQSRSMLVTTKTKLSGINFNIVNSQPLVDVTISPTVLDEDGNAVSPSELTYSWYRVDSSSVETLIAATSTYTPTTSDLGYYLKLTVTAADGSTSYTGTVSNKLDALVRRPFTTAKLNGDLIVGSTLSVTLTPDVQNVANYVTCTWYRSSTKGGIDNLIGSGFSSYTLTGSDFGYYITVRIANGSQGYIGSSDIFLESTTTVASNVMTSESIISAESLPELYVNMSEFAYDPLLVLDLALRSTESASDSATESWTINWGDGETSSLSNRAASANFAHLYRQNGTFEIALVLKTDNNRNTLDYSLGYYTVSSIPTAPTAPIADIDFLSQEESTPDNVSASESIVVETPVEQKVENENTEKINLLSVVYCDSSDLNREAESSERPLIPQVESPISQNENSLAVPVEFLLEEFENDEEAQKDRIYENVIVATPINDSSIYFDDLLNIDLHS